MKPAPKTLCDELAEEMAAMARLSEGPRIPRAAWVQRVADGEAPTLDLEALCELATEDPDGPLDAIRDLIAGLMLRHAGDDVTTSALSAIMHYHLPNYAEGWGHGL